LIVENIVMKPEVMKPEDYEPESAVLDRSQKKKSRRAGGLS
jgi:hypothetical protein